MNVDAAAPLLVMAVLPIIAVLATFPRQGRHTTVTSSSGLFKAVFCANVVG